MREDCYITLVLRPLGFLKLNKKGLKITIIPKMSQEERCRGVLLEATIHKSLRV